MSSRLHQLSALGQSVWIDYLSRDLIETGALARAVDEDAVVGVTSNPTIFAKALAHGHAYDEQIAASDGDAKSVFLELAMRDVTTACDLLRPVWERTEGRDGYVSIEVDPNLAGDTAATIAQATHFHEAIARPNLLVKIPATDAGVPAIEEMTARGYAINVTLIFSLARHRQVAEAYLRGSSGSSPRAATQAVSTRSPASSSRASTPRPTAASPKPVGRPQGAPRHRQREARLPAVQGAVPRRAWADLAARGATAQRCLWASTSVKDPSLRDTLYVEELIGPETISTMPEETIRAFQDHGRVEPRLESDLDEAQYLFDELSAAGVDYDASSPRSSARASRSSSPRSTGCSDRRAKRRDLVAAA